MAGPSFEGASLEAGSGHGEHRSAAVAPERRRDHADEALEFADEVARLEGLLVECARALQAQKAELARAHRLLRDAASSFELALAPTPDPIRFGQLERQRDAAAARALEAEAARAELAFRLDELLGHIAEAGATTSAPARAETGEPFDVAYARLAGTVRGLTSVLAETQEAHDAAGARLLLHERDLGSAKQHAHELERELAEARERIELEALKAHGLAQQLDAARQSHHGEATRSARQTDELRGELAGARARRDEGEGVAETLVAALEALTPRQSSEITVLRHALAQETETSHEAASALARAQAECMVLSEQLTRMKEDAAALRMSMRTRDGVQDRGEEQRQADLSAAQHSMNEQRSRAERLRDALREARHLLGELAGTLDRTSRSVAPVTRAAEDDASGDEPTQPGMPTYIEAMEGLEELVALRDDHIRDLTTKLQLERDRVRAVERAVRALEPNAGSLPSAEWAELLALVQRR